MEQDVELVLFRRQQLLFVRREYHLLFQGRFPVRLCYLFSEPKKRGNRANGSCDCFIGAQHIVFVDAYFLPFAQNHRFISFMLYVFGESQSEMLLAETLWPLTFFVRDRLHGLCDEPAKAVLETTIRSVLLGPHDATVDRRFEVG
jgi:hypothetical protein